MTEAAQLTKRCTKCGEEKWLEEFHKQKHGKFGKESRCKACRAEQDSKGWHEGRRGHRVNAGKEHCRNRGDCASPGIGLCVQCAAKAPARRAAIGVKTASRWATLEYRERVSSGVKKAWESESYREAVTGAYRQWVSDPGNVKILAEARYLYHERRRENEEFEAFMERMEREQEDADTASAV